MKKFTTVICCVSLAIVGICMAISNSPPGMSQNTISAATVNPLPLPFDLQLSQMKAKGLFNQDTVYVNNSRTDTVYVDRVKIKYKDKPTPVVPDEPSPQLIPDSVPRPSPILMDDSLKVREEKTLDRCIILSVDGKIVYSSKNDNHSAEGEGQ